MGNCGFKESKGRRLLKAEVVEYVFEAIFHGEYKPGERIKELVLAKKLGVSQNTVREALRELENKGFVTSIPFKGTFVREFDSNGLEDYFRARTAIETVAVRWSFENKQKYVDWDTLDDCLKCMQSAVSEEDLIAFRKTDMAFHRILVAGAGSASLLAAWDALNHIFYAYLGIQLGNKLYTLEKQYSLHQEIIDAFRRKDLERFRYCLEKHYVPKEAIDVGNDS